jgi:hypothetical protein
MKRKIFALLTVMLLAGCGSTDNTESESKGSSEITLETGEPTTQATTQTGEKDSILGVAEDNYIDYNEVCANIIIDGNTYSMPFTYDDISKDYDCAEAKKATSEGYYIASLVNKDEKKLTVEIKDEETNGEDLNDKPITSIMVSAYTNDLDGTYYYDDQEEKGADVSFNGVRLGMTLQELQQAWGGADMYQDQDTKGTAYTYMSGDQKMTVQVMVDKEDVVYSITLVNHRI